MKQFSVRELSASLTRKVQSGPFEITHRGEVIATVYPKRKIKVPDYAALMKKNWGAKPKPFPDFENLL